MTSTALVGARCQYVGRLLEQWKTEPSRVVIHHPMATVRAGEAARRVERIADGLHEVGVRTGDVVALLLDANSPDLLLIRYAAHLSGVTVTSIRSANPRTDERELPVEHQRSLVRMSRTSYVVTVPHLLERANAIAAGDGPAVLVLDASGTLDRPGGGTAPLHEPWEDEPAVIAYTSGTSGPPRGLRQSAPAWDAMIDVYGARSVEAARSTVLLVWTPLHHTVGSMVDAVLSRGGAIVVHDGFDAVRVLEHVARHHVTDMYVPTPHLAALAAEVSRRDVDLSSLRSVVYSGTPIAARRLREAHVVFGSSLIQLYGSTEAGGISALGASDHDEPELWVTVGRPFPWVEVRLLRDDCEDEVADGTVGEVAVRSATTMSGYLDDPCDRRGWMRTGDLGHWNRYGYLVLAGRQSGVIKRGGLKILPRAVEEQLEAHPGVGAAVVFGVEDEDRVEHVVAALSPCGGRQVDDSELRAWIERRLGIESVPTLVRWFEALPLTAQGKPDTATLRHWCLDAGTGHEEVP